MVASTVLVVEDNEPFRELLAMVLRASGYAVREAADGHEGLERLRDSPHPALILLDLAMPGVDGWQFRAAQLEDPELAKVPVAVITANGKPGDAEALGAAAFLQKPVGLDEVLGLIQKLCPRRDAMAVAAAGSARPTIS